MSSSCKRESEIWGWGWFGPVHEFYALFINIVNSILFRYDKISKNVQWGFKAIGYLKIPTISKVRARVRWDSTFMTMGIFRVITQKPKTWLGHGGYRIFRGVLHTLVCITLLQIAHRRTYLKWLWLYVADLCT